MFSPPPPTKKQSILENLRTTLKIKYLKKRKRNPVSLVNHVFLIVWLYSVSEIDHQAIFLFLLHERFQDTQSLVGSPSTRVAPHIIGAEDDDFGSEHEQVMTFSF